MTKSYLQAGIVGCLVILAMAGCQPRTRETILVPLELVVGKPPKPISNGIAVYDITRTMPPTTSIAKPISGPCGLQEMFIGSRKTAVAYEIDNKKERVSRIWADLDGNNRFDPSEEAVNIGSAAGYPTYSYLKFKGVPRTNDRPLYVAGMSLGKQGIGIVGDAYMKGKVEIGGKTIELQIYDSDLDGKFGTNNGFYGDQITYKLGKDNNTTDASDYLALGFGLYYKPFVNSDKQILTLIKYTSKLGRIEAPRGKIVSLGLFNRHGQFRAISDKTSVSVPEGQYSLCQADLEIKGEDGQMYSVIYRLEGGMNVEVKNDKPIFLGFLEKPTMKVEAKRIGGYVYVQMAVSDKDGWLVTNFNSTATSKPPSTSTEPIVRIADSRGLTVASGPMSNYWTRRCFNWKVPGSQSAGEFTVDVSWKTGVFGDLSAKTGFRL